MCANGQTEICSFLDFRCRIVKILNLKKKELHEHYSLFPHIFYMYPGDCACVLDANGRAKGGGFIKFCIMRRSPQITNTEFDLKNEIHFVHFSTTGSLDGGGVGENGGLCNVV